MVASWKVQGIASTLMLGHKQAGRQWLALADLLLLDLQSDVVCAVTCMLILLLPSLNSISIRVSGTNTPAGTQPIFMKA